MSEDQPTQTQTTLLPCPFCGSTDAHVFKSRTLGGWAVECDGCMTIVLPQAEGRNQATSEWNKRPAEAHVKAPGWTCAARQQGTAGGNDPMDCNWPLCGCDPHADKVVAALAEMEALHVK
jgi:Lar family restriction alleviation protein